MSKHFVISTQELTKIYGQAVVVDHLDLQVPEQQITAFLGRNGAGKSTTIKMLLGITHPSSGSGTVLKRPILDAAQNRAARCEIAYVSEDKHVYPYMTVEQLIRFAKSFYPTWRTEVEGRLLRQFELPLTRKVRALSKGMRGKLALLLALSRRPTLLILDEPSEGLDPVGIEELLQELMTAAADGVTIFFSSHQIAEVERIADRACIIDRGKLRMSISMEEMRQRCRRVTLAFQGDPPHRAFDFPGVRRVRTDGRQTVLFAQDNVDALIELARAEGAAQVAVDPVSLRELFLETVKENQDALV